MPRDLGVAIRRLVVWDSGTQPVLGYDFPRLTEGFNGAETAERLRWTMGDGLVPGRVLAAFDGRVEVGLDAKRGFQLAHPAR